MDQRVDEVQAEPDGDDQSDDRLTHGARLLKPPHSEGVNAHQRQNHASERHKCDIEHDPFLAVGSPTVKRRKLSIPNQGRGYKDSIKLRGDAMSRRERRHALSPAWCGRKRSPSRSLDALVRC
jgi:hypothetical protein